MYMLMYVWPTYRQTYTFYIHHDIECMHFSSVNESKASLIQEMLRELRLRISNNNTK